MNAFRFQMLVACGLLALPVAAQPPAGVWSVYHDYGGLTRDLKELEQAYPRLVKVESIGKSVQDRDIWLVTICSQRPSAKVPEVLFDGAMHGSEVIGAESVLQYAHYLVEHYSGNGGTRSTVDGARTYLIPMVNPDGVEAGKTARSWKMARKNAHSVNLNRNFDWNWDEAGAEDATKEDYRGPSPFSEPESRVVRDFIQSHPLMMYLNCHAGENREPHTVTPLHSKDGPRFEALSGRIEQLAGFTRTRGALAGGAFNWAYWIGMDKTRSAALRPLAIALEIYADANVEPQSKNWWNRYNPPQDELRGYLDRVRLTFMELTEQAHASRR